ncbi:MAG TPA: DUF58 domain-containing protein, partial [Burkholderiaceae bacterium]
MRRLLRKPLEKWLFQMGGAEAGEVYLKQRRVFIVPTRPGLGLAAVLVVLFIGAVNYNLNLGYALTFIVGGCALVDMHLTFRNLAHLYLSAARTAPVFAGEEAQFQFNLRNAKTLARYALHIGFYDARGKIAYPEQAVDVPAQAIETVTLFLPCPRRGWMRSPRVRLQTRFPLGLLRAWSYWFPDCSALVYPRPEDNAPPLPLAHDGASTRVSGAGQDDFGGIRHYQPGDAMRHLAWRQIARISLEDGGQLVTK